MTTERMDNLRLAFSFIGLLIAAIGFGVSIFCVRHALTPLPCVPPNSTVEVR